MNSFTQIVRLTNRNVRFERDVTRPGWRGGEWEDTHHCERRQGKDPYKSDYGLQCNRRQDSFPFYTSSVI